MKKLFLNVLFLTAFSLPYGIVSAADSPDDATMDVIEHSNSEHYEHEIELPDAASPEAEDHAMNHDSKEDSSEAEGSEHESPEMESPENETPEIETPEVESPDSDDAAPAPTAG